MKKEFVMHENDRARSQRVLEILDILGGYDIKNEAFAATIADRVLQLLFRKRNWDNERVVQKVVAQFNLSPKIISDAVSPVPDTDPEV